MEKTKKEKKKKTHKDKLGKHVLVTTAYRGVFFGELASDVSSDEVTLTRCQNVVRWRNMRGFVDLAASGPNSDCRISTILAGEIVLYSITSVLVVDNQDAIDKFRSAPWG